MRQNWLHFRRKLGRTLGVNYLALRERPTQFLALTSLHLAEFDDLLTAFSPFWERYHRYHALDGDRRKFPVHQ